MQDLMVYRHIGGNITSSRAPDVFAVVRDRLFKKTLASQWNYDLMEARIREIYHEVSNLYADQDHYGSIDRIPSMGLIADILDDENREIITETLDAYRDQVSAEEFESIDDAIMVQYDHEIGCYLDDWVEAALLRITVPFINKRNMVQNGHCGNPMPPETNVLLPDFLKGGFGMSSSFLTVDRPTDIYDNITQWPDFYMVIGQMFDQELILSYPEEPAIAERCKIKVLECYRDSMQASGGIPWFDSIVNAALSWNLGVYYQAAKIERDLNPDSRAYSLEALAEGWQEEAETALSYELENYVRFVLDSLECAYLVSYDDEYFWQDNMVRTKLSSVQGFVVNDAQNILFPEVASFHQIGFGSWINIHPNKTSDLMLLTGGGDNA